MIQVFDRDIMQKVAEEAVTISKRRGFRSSQEIASQLLSSIRTDVDSQPLRIAVVGEFSSGKTSILNGLVGKEILPVGLPEMTAAWYHIRMVPEPDKERMITPDGSVFPIEDLKTAKPQSQGKVEVDVVAPNLPQGLEFYDTPGLSAVVAGHREITSAALKEADAVLLVVNAVKGTIPATSLEFLRVTDLLNLPTYLVVNWCDSKTETQRAEILRECLEKCSDLSVRGGVTVSAKAKPGLEELRKLIQGEIALSATELKAEATRSRLAVLCRSLMDNISAYRKALNLDTSELDKELARLRSDRASKLRDMDDTVNLFEREAKDMISNTVKAFYKNSGVLPGQCAPDAAKSQSTQRFKDEIESVWRLEGRKLADGIRKLLDGLDADFSVALDNEISVDVPGILKIIDLATLLAIVFLPTIGDVLVLVLRKLGLEKLKGELLVKGYKSAFLAAREQYASEIGKSLNSELGNISADIKRLIRKQAEPILQEKEDQITDLEDKKRTSRINVDAERVSADSDLDVLKQARASLEMAAS